MATRYNFTEGFIMKRIMQLFMLILFAVATITAFQPAKAQQSTEVYAATCDASTHTLTAYISDVVGSVDLFIEVMNPYFSVGSFTKSGSGLVIFTITDSHFVNGAEVNVIEGPEHSGVSTTCTEQACTNLDDRLNPVCIYPEQSAAVYCREHNIEIYAVNESVGYFAFTVTPQELAKFPLKPEHNILIKQKLGARLYKLTSGLYQVNRIKPDGKEYTFIFEGC
jgi:hypothetical protein